jgi:hypothetical protein
VGLTDEHKRFEFKYLVGTMDVPRVVESFGGYLTPDPNSDPAVGYSLYSVYWDSGDFRFFWEKIEGLKQRRKLRLRRYGTGPDIQIEIKQRIDRTLQKRRLRWPVERVREVFGSMARGSLPAETDLGHPVAAEAAVLCRRFGLTPRVGVRYRRRAFFGAFEPNLRVTFDSRVQYQAGGDVDLTAPFDVGKYIVDPRSTIMEIKFTGRVPLWLSRLVSTNDLQMIRMSKYCSAVDREYYDGQLT